MSKHKHKDEPQAEQTAPNTADNQARQEAETLEAQLHQALSKQDEYLLMAQRVQADFDNFRRRNRMVSAESFDDGARAFIKTILPVCDNLERALSEPREDDPLYTGVALVYRQLQDALAQRGVEGISRKGEPFDPTLEDAIAQAGPEEGEPGTVCDVVVKGYRMGETILRHAMVRVVADT